MKKSVGFLGALFLSFTAIATADGLGDETIRLAVEKNLEKAHVTFGGGPFVAVDESVVALTGRVESLWAKKKAVEAGMDVAKVAAVDDQLEIAFGESDQKVGEAIVEEVRRYAFFTVYDDVNIGYSRRQRRPNRSRHHALQIGRDGDPHLQSHGCSEHRERDRDLANQYRRPADFERICPTGSTATPSFANTRFAPTRPFTSS